MPDELHDMDADGIPIVVLKEIHQPQEQTIIQKQNRPIIGVAEANRPIIGMGAGNRPIIGVGVGEGCTSLVYDMRN